jgi:hypothetical protein
MNAKARTARQIVKARRQAITASRKGLHTVTSHALKAGVAPEDAAGIGNAIRAKAKALGIQGVTAIIVRRTGAGTRPVKGARRYARHDVAQMLAGYNPRVAKFVAAKAQMLAYATAA